MRARALPLPAPAARARRLASSFASMPGPRPLPVIGNLMLLKEFQDPHSHKFLSVWDLYGDAFKFNIPGMGPTVLLKDPREFRKVLVNDPAPYGGVEMHAASIRMLTEDPREEARYSLDWFSSALDPSGRWQRARKLAQPDIFPPKAALEGLPAIAHAARLASRGFGRCGDDMHGFVQRASFDMFFAFALGRMTESADLATPTDPKDAKFVEDIKKVVDAMIPIMLSPVEIASSKLGVHTRRFTQFVTDNNAQAARSGEIADDVIARAERGELTEYERHSWLGRAHARGTMSLPRLKANLQFFLGASVDTTSSVIAWLVVNLARNPEAQRALRAELRRELGGGPLTRAVWESGRAQIPMLLACIRESHRLNPVVSATAKKARQPIEIAGYEVPEGVMLQLSHVSPVTRGEAFAGEAPDEFRPARFLPAAIRERAGTERELLDHPLLSTPFSAGARMCPGSRVARLEVAASIAAIVQEWEFELSPGQPPFVSKLELMIWPTPFPKFDIKPAA